MTGAAGSRRERGYVTAEAAIVIPLLIAVTAALAWAVTIGVAKVRAVDAARDGARALARGDSRSLASSQALDQAPDGSRFVVRTVGDDVTVTVRASARAPGWLLVPLPDVDVTSEATVAVEPGVGAAP